MMTESLRYVDAHCHMDLFPDYIKLVNESDAHGIETIAVTTTPRAWNGNLSRVGDSRNVHVALGLHPQVASFSESDLEIFEQHLPFARFIGEIGLDLSSNFKGSSDIQIAVLERILGMLAKTKNKVLSVHSLRAESAVFEAFNRHQIFEKHNVILHWFTGTVTMAKRAIERGAYFSVNAKMLESRSGNELISILPNNRLLTETDGPFIKIQNRPSRPLDIKYTVKSLALVKGYTEEEMKRLIWKNYQTLIEER